MELFKLFGTIACKNDEANEAIDETTDKAEQSENKMSTAFKKIGAAVATYLAADKIINFGKSCIEAAADADAAKSQFSQVFGNLEGEASKSLSGIADDAGIMETRMKGSYTKIAAFAKTTGMDTDSALQLANRSMVAIADSAAFYDRSLEETTESLQSFLKGNYENDAALGLSCTEVTRNEAANRLYGQSFKDLSEEQKQLTLLQMVEDANELSGAIGQAARESDTWTNQTGNLKQAWTDFKALIGSQFLDVAVQGVKAVSEVIQDLTAKMPEIIQWFKEHESTIKVVATVLGALTAGVIAYKVAMAIGGIISAAANALNGMTLAQYALNLAMNLNPIGLVVAAIAALIVVGIALYKNWDTVKEKALELWGKLTETFENIKEAITEAFTKAKEAVTNKVKEIGDSIKNSKIVQAASTVFNDVKDTVSNVMSTTVETAKEKLKNMKTAYEENGGGINGIVSAAFTGIRDTMGSLMSAANTLTGGKLDSIHAEFSSKLNAAKSTVSSVLEGIRSAFSSKLDAAKSIVSSAIEKIKSFFKFEWSLPEIKMPHFSIKGGFSLNPPKIPSFSVDWYDKAMDNPMIMEKPTIFGVNPATGQPMGGGETGSEVVSGTNTLMGMIRAAVKNENRDLIDALQSLFDDVAFLARITVNLDGKPIANELADATIKRISRSQLNLQKAGGL